MNITWFVLMVLPFVFGSVRVYAQEYSSGYAVGTEVNEETLLNGDILCTTREGVKKCVGEYNPDIFGVYAVNPAVNLDMSDIIPKSVPVIHTGNVSVRVSAVNGAVIIGDYISTSSAPGVGQKATRGGVALGVALSEFDSADKQQVGLIQVAINIRPVVASTTVRGNVLEVIKQGLVAPTLTPLASLRYLLAILIALISLTLGFIYFGKTARSGVEAMGRNPMATRVIAVGMILNMMFTLIVVAGGLFIAYLVLII